MQPINYMQGYQNPLETILGQVRAFQDFSQNANVLASQREQNRITMAHNDRRIQAMKELQGIDFGDENALRAFHGRYGDLEYGQGLKSYFDNLDEKRKKAEIGQLSQVYSALRNNRPNVAKEYLLAQATAYENAGDKVNADGARQMVQMIETDPQMALQNVAFHYAYAVPKEASENYERLVKTQKPDLHIQNAGGYLQGVIQDPVTGEVTTQELGNITQSADNVANNATQRYVAEGGWQNAQNVAHIQGGYDLQERQIQEAGANARSQAQMQVDLQKQQMEMAYKAQQERAKNGQMLVDENGYQFIYYPNEGRAEYMLDPNGQRVKPYSADTAKALKAERDRFNKLTTSLNEAMKLLPDSTGSLVGTWVDGTLGAFGVSTKGAEVGAKLKSIGGQLTSLMPRMEGPQSNMDVQMYEKMAGDVGNTKIPIAQRIEALKTVQDLANKYAHLQGVYTDEYASKNTQTSQPTPTSYDSMKLK